MSLNSTHPFLHKINNPGQPSASTFKKVLNLDLKILCDVQSVIFQNKIYLPLIQKKSACFSMNLPAFIF